MRRGSLVGCGLSDVFWNHRMKRHATISHTALALLLATMLALPGAAQAAGKKKKTATPSVLEGQVAEVIDGDSLRFAEAHADTKADPKGEGKAEVKLLEVRLVGIDAPEGCQAWGPEAREALREHVAGKPVQLRTQGLDTYQRTLAVLVVDGMDVNERMVAEGHAWSQRFQWDKGPYVEKERVAKALKRGLHGTPGAVLPKDFRRVNGACEGPPTGPASAAAATR